MRVESAMLLEHGADVNASAICGTPLHVAAQQGSRECVELLLRRSADLALVNGFSFGSSRKPLINRASFGNQSEINPVTCIFLDMSFSGFREI